MLTDDTKDVAERKTSFESLSKLAHILEDDAEKAQPGSHHSTRIRLPRNGVHGWCLLMIYFPLTFSKAPRCNF